MSNPEAVSPLMDKAIGILTAVNEFHGVNGAIAYRAVEMRTLRHGRFQVDIGGLHYDEHPEDLYKDFDRYGEILYIEDIKLGYILHDALGKSWTNTDASIWYSNAKVSPEELDRIKRHHVIGHDRLYAARENMAKVPIHQVVYDIALWHHEKRDGSGILGKTWDTIPHVVQVATIIDQIVSRCQESSYRKGKRFNLKRALADVCRGWGMEFNAEVFDNLEEMFKKNVHMKLPSLQWLGEFS